MKKMYLCCLSLTILAFAACRKEDPGPKMRREAEQKLLGNWNMVRRVEEIYDPVPQLSSVQEYSSGQDETFIFQTDGWLVIDTGANNSIQETFSVINPGQVWIGDTAWRMENLSDHQLTLVWQRNNAEKLTGQTTKIYLAR